LIIIILLFIYFRL